MDVVSADEARWRRFSNGGLLEPTGSAVEQARRLIGAQAQFVPPAGLALQNRSDGTFTEEELDQLLHVDKTLIRLWGQRRTVHVYDTRDWETVVALSSALPDYRARLVDLLDRTERELEDVLDRVERIVERDGRVCRADLVAEDPTLRPWFQFGTGIMMDLVRRGLACHAGLEGSRSYFAHRATWLPDRPWSPADVDAAGTSLARRYFETYGPATEADFVFWTGARAAEARRWIELARADLTEVVVDGVGMLEGRATPHPAAPESLGGWPFLMLHRFDPLLLAHKAKEWIVDDTHYKAVWRKAGYVEAVLVKGGRITGTWGYRKKGRSIEVDLAPFGRLTRRDRRTCERTAERVAAYFGLPLGGVSVV